MSEDGGITIALAAEILNVSREYLVSLLDAGKIPYAEHGTQQRVRLAELLGYKQRCDAEAREVMDELTREAQELGIGY